MGGGHLQGRAGVLIPSLAAKSRAAQIAHHACRTAVTVLVQVQAPQCLEDQVEDLARQETEDLTGLSVRPERRSNWGRQVDAFAHPAARLQRLQVHPVPCRRCPSPRTRDAFMSNSCGRCRRRVVAVTAAAADTTTAATGVSRCACQLLGSLQCRVEVFQRSILEP